MIPRFPAYLFDIDGTLLDSAPDICAAQSEVLVAAGYLAPGFESLRRFVGLELRAVFRAMIPGVGDGEIQRLSEEYGRMYRSRKNACTHPYPGVIEALGALTGKKSTATTKSTAGTKLVLEHFGLLPYFDHVQGSDGMRYKPAPDVVLAAIAGLGTTPEDCLLVGDSPADMGAGRAAGVKICAVTYGYGDPHELAKWQPDYQVSDLRELVG